MPAKWQQWYPHYIDPWQASAGIHDLSDAAYRAYHNLIQQQYQSEDGMLPDNEIALAKLSRKASVWVEIREELRCLFVSNGQGRLFSPRQYEEWSKAQELYEKRRCGANKTNKSLNILPHAQRTLSERSAAHIDSNSNSNKDKNKDKEQKPPREKRAVEFSLPDWIPVDPWNAYLAMRKAKRAPATQFAAKLVVVKLTKFRADGHDPVAVLEQSIRNSWTDVFPVRDVNASKPNPGKETHYESKRDRIFRESMDQESAAHNG